MENTNKTILVLWDFSPKAECAFAHAVNFAEATNVDITLLHVVKTDKEVSAVEQKLSEIAQRLSQQSKLTVNFQVIKGTIFKSISSYASHSHVEMVVMATHGIRGLQRVTGSWAIKVIRGSKVPFLVVQDMPQERKYDCILFPIDFKKENIEKIKWAHFLYNLYKGKIYIIHPRVSDQTFKKRIYSNMVFTKKYFDNTDIPYTIDTVGKDLAKETIEYAKKINANLILIALSKTLTFADYLMGPAEQDIIANDAKIPVMVISPRPKQVSGGFSATGT
ncbi:MAG: universal stress protein [Bacteroidales bacterium]|nr:universal stress protein [Bacteroidales bacterium]